MAAVRFASICDVAGCSAASAEYSAFPYCIQCGEDICPAHMVRDSQDDETGRCLCLRCEAVQREEEKELQELQAEAWIYDSPESRCPPRE